MSDVIDFTHINFNTIYENFAKNDVNDGITYFLVHLYLEVLKYLSTDKMNKTALIKF